MTYRELYEKADRKLEKGEITIGEFDEMTKPLDEEIRPHGEWIKRDKSFGFADMECSKCHVLFEDWDTEYPMYNFCPNCGADMRTKNVRSWDTSSRGVSGPVDKIISPERR